MADYKELLRRAIEVLPENNGAARRAVYEKARSALVAQLRAITPPLPAREITQHRLQLEDCIRQVEQEASEAVISGLKAVDAAPVAPKPAPQQAPAQQPPAQQPPVQQAPSPAVPPPGQPQAGPAPANAPPAASGAPARVPPRTSMPDNRPAAPPVPAANPGPQPSAGPVAPAVVPVSPTTSEAPAARPPEVRAPEPVRPPEPAPAAMPEAARILIEAETPEPGIDVPARAVVPVKPEVSVEPAPGSIEDIIAEAERATADAAAVPAPPVAEGPAPEEPGKPAVQAEAPAKPQEPARNEPRVLPTIVARSDAPRPPSGGGGAPTTRLEPVRRGPTFEPRIAAPRIEPAAGRGQTAALQQVVEPVALLEEPTTPPAMSSVREVELEPVAQSSATEAQVAIDRAIATLDREARGETVPLEPVPEAEAPTVPTVPPIPAVLKGLKREPRGSDKPLADTETGFARAPGEDERGGISAVTIFLVVFVMLLAGAGGAGYWAWREGWIDLETMFARSSPVVAEAQTPEIAPAEPSQPVQPATAQPQANAGNTTTPEAVEPTTELKTDDRLAPVEPAATPPAEVAAAPAEQTPIPAPDIPKSEDRLPVATAEPTPEVPAADAPALDATAAAGSQSLLLEASDNGTTGAVPFSGTVEWSRAEDETGQPTLVGKANIPARNLGVDVLIRKNMDPSLPASHLMEIKFSVTDSFIGGSIANLPGVLLKNEELVQGTPLVGASARVVGNSFLFALSGSAEDATANEGLLTSRKWMDLAVVYATGKRAIITLEKDPDAEKLFADVFGAWEQAPTASTE